jgi:hypothetical protein
MNIYSFIIVCEKIIILMEKHTLQERVNYYNTNFNKVYSNEALLFKLLCELYWETASNPDTNDLIILVFESRHTSQGTSIKDSINRLFYTLSKPYSVTNTYSDGTQQTIIKAPEPIISVLFLKFIHYFALFILEQRSPPELCEPLSNLTGLVGLTDNEGILNGAVVGIGNFLNITTESNDEIRAIIDAIHNIFTQRLQIAVPDNISIQVTISVISKHRLRELSCPTYAVDDVEYASDDDSDDDQARRIAASKNKVPRIVKTEIKPTISSHHTGISKKKPECKYGKACYRKHPDHFKIFYHPPRYNPTKPYGRGGSKSKRTRRRIPSSKRTRHRSTKRRRHSTKRRTTRRR